VKPRNLALCFLLFSNAHAVQQTNRSLHYFAFHGIEKIVSQKCGKGANPNQLNEFGETPLHFSSKKGHWRTTNYLLKAGADPNQKDCSGSTALMNTVEKGYLNTFMQLLPKSNVNTVDKQGMNILTRLNGKIEKNRRARRPRISVCRQYLMRYRLRHHMVAESITKKNANEKPTFECPVCLGDFQSENKLTVATSNCLHVLCQTCASSKLLKRCPLCRAPK